METICPKGDQNRDKKSPNAKSVDPCTYLCILLKSFHFTYFLSEEISVFIIIISSSSSSSSSSSGGSSSSGSI